MPLYLYLVLISLDPETAVSQTASSASSLEILLIISVILLIIVTLLVLVVALYSIYALKTILLSEKESLATAEGRDHTPPDSFWQNISRSLTKSTPVVEEESILMDHDYDGIRELDNHLPPWWKFLFYFTIVWAAIYLLAYHVFNVLPLSGEEYDREVAEAEAALEVRQALLSESIDENTVEFTDDPGVLSNGQTIFKAQCAVCHAADGGGGVGPNFTDEYWLHGGSIKNIFWIIKYGVPEKGMISWQSQLPPTAMRDVSCYIFTLKGTSAANPKEPQGDLYEEGTVVSIPDAPPEKNILLVSDVKDSLDAIQIGRGLFKGSLSFTTGGPACIMCHQVTDDELTGGGLIAPELTNVYTRLDENSIIKRIINPYHATMQEAYNGKPVTDEEAAMLLSFFKNAGTKGVVQQQRDKRAAGFLDRIKKSN